MSSLLRTDTPPEVLQPFLRQLNDHSVNAALVPSWSGSGEGEGPEGESRTFFGILRISANDESIGT